MGDGGLWGHLMPGDPTESVRKGLGLQEHNWEQGPWVCYSGSRCLLGPVFVEAETGAGTSRQAFGKDWWLGSRGAFRGGTRATFAGSCPPHPWAHCSYACTHMHGCMHASFPPSRRRGGRQRESRRIHKLANSLWSARAASWTETDSCTLAQCLSWDPVICPTHLTAAECWLDPQNKKSASKDLFVPP